MSYYCDTAFERGKMKKMNTSLANSVTHQAPTLELFIFGENGWTDTMCDTNDQVDEQV